MTGLVANVGLLEGVRVEYTSGWGVQLLDYILIIIIIIIIVSVLLATERSCRDGWYKYRKRSSQE